MLPGMSPPGAIEDAPADRPPSSQAAHNATVWQAGAHVADYDHATLLGAESIVLVRYREAIEGRVLDVGCGAGRLLAYLRLLGADAHGVDISPAMVAHCRARFPGIDVHVGDLRDLRRTETGHFDAVIISDNTLDVFDDRERRGVLADLAELLAPGGVLVFASHNLDCWDREGGEPPAPGLRRVADWGRAVIRARDGSPLRSALGPLRARRNRARLRPRQTRAADHAVLNDSAHHSSLLHYYIGADAQRAQLAGLGFDTLDVLELDGTPVAAGESGSSLWLHYVARIASPA
jgi:SAM-dependent methyltransferase